MIPFDAFTLAAVAHELRRLLPDDSRVQRIYQPSPADLILSFFSETTGAHKLLLSADPRTFRVHLTQVRRESPKIPPAFCLVCRKDLEGAWLTNISMPRFDRVLRLSFRAPEGGSVFLFAELMGRNSNLILVSNTGMIRGVIRPAPTADRPLKVGGAYDDPPGYQDRRDLFAVAADELKPEGDFTAQFAGLGKFVQSELQARAANLGDGNSSDDKEQQQASEWAALLNLMDRTRCGDFEPHSIGDAQSGATSGVWVFAPVSVPPGLRFPRESVQIALDTFYATLRADETEAGEKATLTKAIAREVAYRQKEIESARKTIAEADRADEYERWGNLLLANLHAIEKGNESVTLADYYNEKNPDAAVTVTLDPKKSAYENAERQFERARKSRDAREYADGRMADMKADLETLAHLKAALERADDIDSLAAVRDDLEELAGEDRVNPNQRTANKRQPTQDKDKPFGGNRVGTYTLDGFTLYVGETADANDHLLTRVAAPSDIWMHVRSGTGAHGVLKTNKQPNKVPDKVLRRAAEIVAFRSGSAQKHSSVVAVDVTERRYVRKPRGAKAGLAFYTQAKTLDVTPKLS